MSTSSSVSLSPSSQEDIIYVTEIVQMMTDETTAKQMSSDFHDDPLSSAVLRNICGIAQTIERLEREIEQQHEEMEDVFECILDYAPFRRTMRPLV